ncbi:hypothetical protein [Paraburkholderia xenovorans]
MLQPRDRFFRNRPRKKPRCYAETAIVVGPKDHTTWVDEYGRVKISYLWDLDGPRNTTASCWARELHEDLAQLAQQHKAQDARASQRDATQTIRAQNDAVRGGAPTYDDPSPEMTRPRRQAFICLAHKQLQTLPYFVVRDIRK